MTQVTSPENNSMQKKITPPLKGKKKVNMSSTEQRKKKEQKFETLFLDGTPVPEHITHLYGVQFIQNLYQVKKSRDTIYRADDKGEIPSSYKRGRYRFWSPEKAIAIAQKYGTIPKIQYHQAVRLSICLTKGGGSHKTTYTFHLARYLALLGFKVLLIPLDFQLNMSKLFHIDSSFKKISQTGQAFIGLSEAIINNISIEKVIYNTTFKNIDIIPETPSLSKLEAHLTIQSFRERILSEKIQPIIKKYDFIISENNPAWSSLSLNSICSSDILISPIGTDNQSSETLETFLGILRSQIRGPILRDIIFVPGFHEQLITAKQNVLDEYNTNYPHLFTKPIRKAANVDIALAKRRSVFEESQSSEICKNYISVCREVLEKIICSIENKKPNEIRDIIGEEKKLDQSKMKIVSPKTFDPYKAELLFNEGLQL